MSLRDLVEMMAERGLSPVIRTRRAIDKRVGA
jgi:hypothetical protein